MLTIDVSTAAKVCEGLTKAVVQIVMLLGMSGSAWEERHIPDEYTGS